MATKRVKGGGFLIDESAPEDIFTPEDFSEEQLQIARTASDFSRIEVLPATAEIEAKNFAVMKGLLRKAGELGLFAADVPEAYGGLEMDRVTSALIAESLSQNASFSVAVGAHSGIGMLPLIWYGTPEQKRKYLPKLVTGEWIAAYALSEASSGSDAMNIRARATLSNDGAHYILNGEKMWISNCGFADLYTVFAKIDGEKFSAFLIERTTPGLLPGSEEHKLGIQGSSTCPLILNDCKVPAGSLLGEVGKGHHIAFNILNIGRFKLGAAAVGGAKTAFKHALQYARDRKAFGKSISQFGLIQEKIADCAVGIFVGESLTYRTIGNIDAALADVDHHAEGSSREIQKRIEEYAVECSILKVWGSEMLDMVVDHVVQIYGGYGYVEDYPAARFYRDARINRIFEGTNEVNRLIITGWLMKRAMTGQLLSSTGYQKGDGRRHGWPGRSRRSSWTSCIRTSLACDGQETRPIRGRCGLAEASAGPAGSTGDHGRSGRYHHRSLRPGILSSPGRKTDHPARSLGRLSRDCHDSLLRSKVNSNCGTCLPQSHRRCSRG